MYDYRQFWNSSKAFACTVYSIIQFERQQIIDMECSLAGGHDTQVTSITEIVLKLVHELDASHDEGAERRKFP
jgi:hypothetical protein